MPTPFRLTPRRTHAVCVLLTAAWVVMGLTSRVQAATCKNTTDCDVGSICGNATCKVVPMDTACTNNEECGNGRACIEKKCATPKAEPRQGTTDVELWGTGLAPDPNTNVIPKLNVKIPGLTFGSESGPLLAQYISASYRYLISLSAVAATVMFVYGAFLYLISTAVTSVKSGKQIMTDAVVGMLLVLGAHLILRTVNPATTTLEGLNVPGVRTEYDTPTMEELSAPGPPVDTPSGGAAPSGTNSPGCDAKGKQTLMIPFPFQPKAAPPGSWKPKYGNILISPGAIDCPGSYPFIYYFHGNTGDDPKANGLIEKNGAITNFKLVLNRQGPASKIPDYYPVIMVVPFSVGKSQSLFRGFNFSELRDVTIATLKANPQTSGITISNESVMGHSGAGCNSLAWGKEVTAQKLFMIGYADTCFGLNGIDKNHAPEKIIADVSNMKNSPPGGPSAFIKDHGLVKKTGDACRLKYPLVHIEYCAEHPTKDWFFFSDYAGNHGWPITGNLIFALTNWFKK